MCRSAFPKLAKRVNDAEQCTPSYATRTEGVGHRGREKIAKYYFSGTLKFFDFRMLPKSPPPMEDPV
jgi:hypothetical protein